MVVELSIVESNNNSDEGREKKEEEEEELVTNEHHYAIDVDDDGAGGAGDEQTSLKLTNANTKTTRHERVAHQMQTSMACDLNQRSFMAHERTQLCYWFRISEQLRMKINGSLTSSYNRLASERLVEAELHVFKLLPEIIEGAEVNFKWKLRPSQDAFQSSSKTTQTVQTSKLNRGQSRLMVNRGQVSRKKINSTLTFSSLPL